jgi:prephenate dehydrogenase
VIGCGRQAVNLERALALGVIDRAELDPRQAVRGADMVVLAVPMGNMAAMLAAIQDDLHTDAVVTDVGSAKTSVLEAAAQVFGAPPPWFVPGHPLAGAERSGVEAARADLFEGRRVILTPTPQTHVAAIERVERMWQATGAEVQPMAAPRHDELLAAVSHLPHVLAYALVEALAGWRAHPDALDYAAGGFRDFSRIASSDPVMWRDICLANREPLLVAMQQFAAHYEALRVAIEQADGARLEAIFSRAKRARDLRFGSEQIGS